MGDAHGRPPVGVGSVHLPSQQVSVPRTSPASGIPEVARRREPLITCSRTLRAPRLRARSINRCRVCRRPSSSPLLEPRARSGVDFDVNGSCQDMSENCPAMLEPALRARSGVDFDVNGSCQDMSENCPAMLEPAPGLSSFGRTRTGVDFDVNGSCRDLSENCPAQPAAPTEVGSLKPHRVWYKSSRAAIGDCRGTSLRHAEGRGHQDLTSSEVPSAPSAPDELTASPWAPAGSDEPHIIL